VHLSVTPDTP